MKMPTSSGEDLTFDPLMLMDDGDEDSPEFRIARTVMEVNRSLRDADLDLGIGTDNTDDTDDDDEEKSMESDEMTEFTHAEQALRAELNSLNNIDNNNDHSPMAKEIFFFGVHDQLPSVEEYKANVQYISKSSRTIFSRINKISSRPDPDGHLHFVDQYITEIDPEDPAIQEANLVEHDQLLSVEQAKTSSSPNNSGNCWRIVCMFAGAILFITMVILLPILLTSDQRSSSRLAEVVKFLEMNQISSFQNLNEEEGSPQSKAAKWIAEDGLPVDDAGFVYRYALAVVYFALGGDLTWPSDLNFLASEHVCNWYDKGTLSSGEIFHMGVHACKTVNDELVPVALAFGMYNIIFRFSLCHA
jgi:hypothetical protein